LPFFVSAMRVNCDTAMMSPPTSRILRFITPSSSSKIRSCVAFFTRYSISSAVSSGEIPMRMSMPRRWLSATAIPSMWTAADRVRWMRKRMDKMGAIFGEGV
jgi:hypothetical protein